MDFVTAHEYSETKRGLQLCRVKCDTPILLQEALRGLADWVYSWCFLSLL